MQNFFNTVKVKKSSWIMLNSRLKTADLLQRKFPSSFFVFNMLSQPSGWDAA